MITIDDVAKKANVSKGTVSKVLKNYPNISEETRIKVMEAVKELGYIPNTLASALSSKRTRRIALYVYINDQVQAIDEINMRYLFGAFKVAKECSLELITCFNESLSSLSKEDYERYFHSLGVQTIIVFGLNKDDEKMHYLLKRNTFKTVIVDAPLFDENRSCVYVDHEHGQYDVAKEVIQPHDRVLYLAGKRNGYVTDQRLNGMFHLQRDLDFKMNVVFAEFSERKAYEVVKEQASQFDVIVCASDLMAIGSAKALEELNLKKRIAGYDGITLMAYAAQDIITCIQDFTEVGKQAVLEAERLLQNKKGREVIMPYKVGRVKYDEIVN